MSFFSGQSSVRVGAGKVGVAGAGDVDVSGLQHSGLIDWEGFAGWLRRRLGEHHAKDMLQYAKRYCGHLASGRLSELEGVAGEKHVMMALANLSKYLGMYDDWKKAREHSGLKWKQGVSSESAFLRLFSGKEDCGHAEAWMSMVKERVGGDEGIWFPIVFCALTGLREVEMLMTLNRVVDVGVEAYPLNRDLQVLENFRHVEFLRRTKRSYVVLLGDGVLERLRGWRTVTSYDKLRMRLRYSGLTCELHGLRKWFGSTLRMGGIESECVDMLCGRVPQSVFVRSYLRYDVKELCSRARSVLEKYEKLWLDC